MTNNAFLNEEQKKQIEQALERASNHPVWGKSKFLTLIGTKINQIHQQFKNRIHASNPTLTQVLDIHENRDLKIFISVYCAKGSELAQWEKVLASLPSQLISRPIYDDEEHVIELIKSKAKPENEAYICVMVNSKNLSASISQDKFNHSLLTFRNNPLSANYEGIFIHQQQSYEFAHGLLKPLQPPKSEHDTN